MIYRLTKDTRYLVVGLGIILFFFMLFVRSMEAKGFLAGTPVRVEGGYYVPIEDIKVGDKIISYNYNGKCVLSPVTKIHKKQTHKLAIIAFDDDYIVCEADQEFYLPLGSKWVMAQYLTSEHRLLCQCNDLISPIGVQIKQGGGNGIEVYDLTIDRYYNFCVSFNDIHVHNMPTFAVGFVYTIGGGFAFWGGIGILGIIGVGMVYNYATKDYTSYNNFQENFGRGHWTNEEYRKPTAEDGYIPKKNCNGQMKPHPVTGAWGWVDEKGWYWIPDKSYHGGDHWDKTSPDGKTRINVMPGGKERGK